MLLIFCLLAVTPLAHGYEINPDLLTATIGNCEASLLETRNLKLGESERNTGAHTVCYIDLKSTTNVSGERISLIFSPTSRIKDNCCIAGFVRNEKEQWQFEGNNALLESRFLKRTFKQEQTGDELLLIGTQLLRGKNAQGGLMDMPGMSVLRITPQFVISVELNFQPAHYEKQTKGYKELREAVSQELVEIVKSIQPTPGQPGPTVRQP
jgi:hypothetical protein